MWWKLCKMLVLLIVLAAIVLFHITKSTGVDHNHIKEDYSDEKLVNLIETQERDLDGTGVVYQPEGNIQSTQHPFEILETVRSAETEIPEPQMEVLVADLEFSDFDWKKVYETLSQFPNSKVDYSKSDSMGKDRYAVSNSKGEYFLIGAGRVFYKLNDKASQLFEIANLPTQATEEEKKLQQIKEKAEGSQSDYLGKEDAQARAIEMITSLLQSDLYRVEVDKAYWYSKEQMQTIHNVLRKDRELYHYFYSSIPDEIEEGIYYLELSLNIDGIPFCSEKDTMNILYSQQDVGSVESLVTIVMSENSIFYLDMSYKYDLNNVQTGRAVSRMEIERYYASEMQNMIGTTSGDAIEAELKYLVVRNGIGRNAKYKLNPVWHLYSQKHGEKANEVFFDAISKKMIF